MHTIFCQSLIALLLIGSLVGAAEFTGTAVSVADGDTIRVRNGSEEIKVRLYGIDAPEIAHKPNERSQPYGKEATDFTRERTLNKQVRVIWDDKDQFGCTVGTVMMADGENLNRELVRNGLAWHYRQYDHDKSLDQLEREAREQHRGLWAGSDPQAPWEFRREQKGLPPARSAPSATLRIYGGSRH